MSSYSHIDSHRAMIFDEIRNSAYAKAIRQAVKSGSTVMDLGAGLGIHGLLAAATGASKVIFVDPTPFVELTKEFHRLNEFNSDIEIIRKRIEDIQELEPVDIIVSVFTGNFLLVEDFLPLLFSARDRFLKPGGVLIPGAARMHAALVSAKGFYATHITRWSLPTLDIDFSPARRFASNTLYCRSKEAIDPDLLSEPVLLQELNFTDADTADCRCETDIAVKHSGTCHGVLGWFDMKLGADWLSTGPDAESTHWSLAFLPLDPPIELNSGDTVQLKLDRPEFGEWTWTVICGQEKRRHSTFQSTPTDISFLKKQSAEYIPQLGSRGELAREVLTHMSAGKSVSEIITQLQLKFPSVAARDNQLESRIRRMIADWAAES